MDDIFAFERGVTAHGLTVYVKHVELPRPQVYVGLTVLCGARQDPVWLPGLSHALEHAFCDAKHKWGGILGKQRFAHEHGFLIESEIGLGATDAEMALWRFKGAPDRLAVMLELLGQLTRVSPANVPLAHLKEILQREYREERDPDKEFLDARVWAPLIPANHAMLKEIRETPETIERLTMKALAEHWRQHYALPNMALFVAGSVTLHEALAAAERAFPVLPHDAGATRHEVQSLRAQYIRSGIVTLHLREAFGDDFHGASEPGMRVVRVTPPRELHYEQALLAMQTVGALCFRLLREEREIAYGFGADITPFRDLDRYEIDVRFDIAHYAECADVLLDLPALMKRRGREDFKQEQSDKIMHLALTDRALHEIHSSAMEEATLFGEVLSYEEQMRVLEETTFDDVVRCVEEFFALDKCFVTTILP
ncbi:MAG: insulinase family protein [Candidatus Harrisonbacteria bacterium]|nr:insulinase family protein [Candidatus Harrisonbacteria bacterium]